MNDSAKRYPFKFLDAYSREDKDFFFGRDEEIQALYEMVFQADIILVYGTSGTGKTSLLQCGLANRFQSHDWMPIPVRRGSDLNVSLENALQALGGTLEETSNNLDFLDDAPTGSEADASGMSPLARRFRAIYLQYFKPIYLIFDQFEELYTLGNRNEQAEFIKKVKEILALKQPVKILISIREEYLGYLYEFEREVPELLRKKLRVEPMNLSKVQSVIQHVGTSAHSNVSLAAGEETAIAERVFNKIRGTEHAISIQLPYLQVFLDKLYLQITSDKTRTSEAKFSLADIEKMGDMGDVLRDFLDEQVLITAQELHCSTDVIWQILSPLATLEGTKEPLTQQALTGRLPQSISPQIIGETLRVFVRNRILRYTEQNELYEISHDSLAKQVHAKRSDEQIAALEVQRLIRNQIAPKPETREYFTEKQLQFIQSSIEKLKLNDEERGWITKSEAHNKAQREAEEAKKAAEITKVRRRNRILAALLVAAFAAFGVAAYLGIEANRQEKLAKAAQKEAETTLNRLRQEQQAKARVEFGSMEERAKIILDGDGCPEEIFADMQKLMQGHPDSAAFSQRYKVLQARKPDCK